MSTTVALVIQFIISVLLAFIGFVLQGLRKDMANSLRISQENQIAIGRLDSKLDGLVGRLGRLEDIQDSGGGRH